MDSGALIGPYKASFASSLGTVLFTDRFTN